MTQDEILKEILEQLKIRMDEGEVFYQEGTADTTGIILDFIKEFNHLVKKYKLINDSAGVVLQVVHITQPETDLDPGRAPGRYASVLSTDLPHEVNYNIKFIRKLGIKTKTGTADYRLWVYW